MSRLERIPCGALTIATLAAALACDSPAQASAPSLLGTWSGTIRDVDDDFPNRMVLEITRLRVGARAGFVTYNEPCQGPVRLVRRSSGGRYVFRHREISGDVDCTQRDRISARLSGRRLRVRVTPVEGDQAAAVGRLRRVVCRAAGAVKC